jgi:hypothetical protein
MSDYIPDSDLPYGQASDMLRAASRPLEQIPVLV